MVGREKERSPYGGQGGGVRHLEADGLQHGPADVLPGGAKVVGWSLM